MAIELEEQGRRLEEEEKTGVLIKKERDAAVVADICVDILGFFFWVGVNCELSE